MFRAKLPWAVWAWLAAVPVAGQEQEIEISRPMAQYLRRLEVTVRSGRLEVSGDYVGQSFSFGQPHNTEERLTIHGVQGLPSIVYTNRSLGRLISIETQELNHIRIERTGGEGREDFQFIQRPGEDLQLRLGRGDTAKVYRASNFWHLLLAQPQICEQELLPLLQILRSGWPLTTISQQVRFAIVEWGQNHRDFDDRQFQRLIDQLGSSKYVERRAAERQLLAQGKRIIPFLMRQDVRQLDAEQRARLRTILTTLDTGRLEDPQQIAIHLVADPRTWLILLDSLSEEDRRVAAIQLETLLGHEISFDPAADDQTRKEQIARLRRQLDPQGAKKQGAGKG